MKKYKFFDISTNTDRKINQWTGTITDKYDYRIAGMTGDYMNGGIIALAYWPKASK